MLDTGSTSNAVSSNRGMANPLPWDHVIEGVGTVTAESIGQLNLLLPTGFPPNASLRDLLVQRPGILVHFPGTLVTLCGSWI